MSTLYNAYPALSHHVRVEFNLLLDVLQTCQSLVALIGAGVSTSAGSILSLFPLLHCLFYLFTLFIRLTYGCS
jgi:hypothetical protein